MVPVQSAGTLQIRVRPVVEPSCPVQVAVFTGDLVQTEGELGARHVRDGVAVLAPVRLGPEDAAGGGVRGVGVPARPDEVEDLLGSGQCRRVPCLQVELDFRQAHPFVVVVEHVAAGAVGARG